MSHQEQEQEQEMLHLCLTGFYLRKPVKTMVIGRLGVPRTHQSESQAVQAQPLAAQLIVDGQLMGLIWLLARH